MPLTNALSDLGGNNLVPELYPNFEAVQRERNWYEGVL